MSADDWSCSVALFRHVRDPRPVARTVTWGGLVAALTRWTVGPAKDAVPLWSPASYPADCTARRSASVVSVSCLVLDYDDGTTLKQAHAAWRDWPHIIHTSWSHTPEHHKCRVVVPLDRPVSAEGWPRVFAWARARAPQIDEKCSDPSRIYFVPSHPEGAQGAWAGVWDEEGGRMLDLDPDRLPKTAAEVAQEQAATRRRAVCWQASDAEIRRDLQDALKTDPNARRTFGASLGGAVHDGAKPRVDRILCPACGRPSVCFWIEPHPRATAWCSHQQSCAWHGWLDQLSPA